MTTVFVSHLSYTPSSGTKKYAHYTWQQVHYTYTSFVIESLCNYQTGVVASTPTFQCPAIYMLYHVGDEAPVVLYLLDHAAHVVTDGVNCGERVLHSVYS